MREFIRIWSERLKLLYLWVSRILFAPDHFHTPLHIRLWLCVHGFVPDQYWLYDLKHRSRRDYLSEFDWYRSRRINGKEAFVLNNKMVCTHLLRQYAFAPELLCFRKYRDIVARDGRILDDEALIELLRQAGRCICKPMDAGKGERIYAIFRSGERFLVNGVERDGAYIARTLRREKGWFLCEYIEQSEFMASFFPDSANTLRVITVRNRETNLPEILFAVQRFGRASTAPVDNASRGGLISCVDLETGELSEAKTLWSTETFLSHPDTGRQICGVRFPFWEDVKRQALSLADHFPYLEFIAWDMLETESGLCVIEANASSGVNIIQLWGGQRHGPLGDVYRRYGIIK